MTEPRKYQQLSSAKRVVFNWILSEQLKKSGDINRKEAYDFVNGKTDEESEALAKSIEFCGAMPVDNKKSGVEHHRIGVMSDTHIGSKYTPDDFVRQAVDYMQENGCELILHCGDLTEGIKEARWEKQQYEMQEGINSYPTMRDLALELFKDLRIPMYVIDGNHDRFFKHNCNIVREICERSNWMHYLGSDNAVFDAFGVKILLWHGEDTFSNMRLKNLAFSCELLRKGIQILLTGHCHKYEVKFIEHCYCIHVPSIQLKSGWMTSKKLIADVGYLIIDFDVIDGKANNLAVQYNILED